MRHRKKSKFDTKPPKVMKPCEKRKDSIKVTRSFLFSVLRKQLYAGKPLKFSCMINDIEYRFVPDFNFSKTSYTFRRHGFLNVLKFSSLNQNHGFWMRSINEAFSLKYPESINYLLKRRNKKKFFLHLNRFFDFIDGFISMEIFI